MHNCCKVGGFVGEICESGRFLSPGRETSSKRETGPKRWSLPGIPVKDGRVIRYAREMAAVVAILDFFYEYDPNLLVHLEDEVYQILCKSDHSQKLAIMTS